MGFLSLFSRKVEGSFRLLEEGEWVTLLRHIRRLPDDQVYARFLSDMTDEALVRWAKASQFNDVIGWFVEGHLRGTVEVGYRGERAECGVTVEDEFRATRVGRQLFHKACAQARSQGATSMAMLTECQGERDTRTIASHPGWEISRCYARSIILPHAEPEHPLWLIRDLSHRPSLLRRLMPGEAAIQD
ncbi:MAG: GNAT family N-acetyltransferase [Pseudomonadota bacterium]